MTQWNRKSVFLGIHLHLNYSDILGRPRSTGVTQRGVLKKKDLQDAIMRAVTCKTKLLACEKKNHRKKSNQAENRKIGSVFLAAFESNPLLLPPPSLPSVTRLSYRHEAKEWGRQSGNIRYHEEWDASPLWHGVHRVRAPPWNCQAGVHTQAGQPVCCTYTDQSAKMQVNCVLLCVQAREMQLHLHPSLPTPTPYFLPPSATRSACVLSYLLQPIIVPTYGVSYCNHSLGEVKSF